MIYVVELYKIAVIYKSEAESSAVNLNAVTVISAFILTFKEEVSSFAMLLRCKTTLANKTANNKNNNERQVKVTRQENKHARE